MQNILSPMNQEFVDLFSVHGKELHLEGEALVAGEIRVPVINGIPRFTPEISYSTGNFSKLRERHALLQLDSVNGTTDRYDTILRRSGWTPEFFRGKLVLECGCGAGPDTEILLGLGCRVISVDIAGVDIAKRNMGNRGDVQFVQADIADLPFRPKSFDIVFCHRVLQHTPDPEKVLSHMLEFVKDDGAAFVHSYAHAPFQLFRWKYVLRPITSRMDPENLYRYIEVCAPFLARCTNILNRTTFGRYFAHCFVPFLNYRRNPAFINLDDEAILEYGVHDTFDALSPKYDRPMRAVTMRRIAERRLRRPFAIDEQPHITILRSLP